MKKQTLSMAFRLLYTIWRIFENKKIVVKFILLFLNK